MSWGIKVTPKTRSVLVTIPKQTILHKRGIQNAHYKIGQDVVDENRRLLNTGPKTGRLYRLSGGQRHQASAPGQAPATRTGRLARSTDYKVHGWRTMTVGQEAPYAAFLERGTRRIAPRPNLIRAINNLAGTTLQAYRQGVKREIKA